MTRTKNFKNNCTRKGEKYKDEANEMDEEAEKRTNNLKGRREAVDYDDKETVRENVSS